MASVACAAIFCVKFLIEELLKFPDYLHGWCQLAEDAYYVQSLLHHGELFYWEELVAQYLDFCHPLTNPFLEDLIVTSHDMVTLQEFLVDVEAIEQKNWSLHGVTRIQFPMPKTCVCL